MAFTTSPIFAYGKPDNKRRIGASRIGVFTNLLERILAIALKTSIIVYAYHGAIMLTWIPSALQGTLIDRVKPSIACLEVVSSIYTRQVSLLSVDEIHRVHIGA